MRTAAVRIEIMDSTLWRWAADARSGGSKRRFDMRVPGLRSVAGTAGLGAGLPNTRRIEADARTGTPLTGWWERAGPQVTLRKPQYTFSARFIC